MVTTVRDRVKYSLIAGVGGVLAMGIKRRFGEDASLLLMMVSGVALYVIFTRAIKKQQRLASGSAVIPDRGENPPAA